MFRLLGTEELIGVPAAIHSMFCTYFGLVRSVLAVPDMDHFLENRVLVGNYKADWTSLDLQRH